MRRRTNLLAFMVIVYLLACVNPAEAWTPEWAKLIATDGMIDDDYGFSVAISGDYAIVGVPGDDDNGSNSGSAYIFKREGKSWNEQAKLLASDGAADDVFGGSVSISGDYAIVGAGGDGSGSAYIFAPNEVNPNNWDQVAKLTASDGAESDFFGSSVSISADYAIVGSLYDDDKGSSSGSAYIFKRDGASWSEQAKLTASDGAGGDVFGESVSICGNYAIIGARGDDDFGNLSGSAYVFEPNAVDPNNWDEVVKLTASDGAEGDRFGESVSISESYAIIGAPRDDDNGADSGSAYIFKRDGASWSEQAKLTASDGAIEDYFGESVSVSGNRVIAGAHRDDDLGDKSGSAYVFEPNAVDPNNWDEAVKLTASDGAAGDYFGYSVAISGNFAIVGAVYDDHSGEVDVGSAYLFSDVSCPAADLDDDCFVGFKDFALFTEEWLQGL